MNYKVKFQIRIVKIKQYVGRWLGMTQSEYLRIRLAKLYSIIKDLEQEVDTYVDTVSELYLRNSSFSGDLMGWADELPGEFTLRSSDETIRFHALLHTLLRVVNQWADTMQSPHWKARLYSLYDDIKAIEIDIQLMIEDMNLMFVWQGENDGNYLWLDDDLDDNSEVDEINDD